MVHAIKSKDEFDTLINSGKIVVIDFWATWCGPCRMISPFFERLEEQFGSLEFCKVDVDEQEAISAEVGIRAMPTFTAFKDGVKFDEVVGADMRKLKASPFFRPVPSAPEPLSSDPMWTAVGHAVQELADGKGSHHEGGWSGVIPIQRSLLDNRPGGRGGPCHCGSLPDHRKRLAVVQMRGEIPIIQGEADWKAQAIIDE